MSDLYTTTSTIEMPIELVDIATWLRLNNNQEDAILNILLETAFYDLEAMTNRIFVSRTMEYYTDDVHYDLYYPYIEINKSPVTAVSDVFAYYEDAYTSISGSYMVDISDEFTKIFFTDTVSYDNPAVHPFKVQFTVGYSTTPADFKLRLLQYINFLYENRGDVSEKTIPDEILAFISKYRIISVL